MNVGRITFSHMPQNSPLIEPGCPVLRSGGGNAPTESHVQLSIIKYLISIGAKVGKTKTMGVKRGKIYCFDPYTFQGFPDLTFFYEKRLYFCEVKAGKNKQSAEQIAFQEYCNEAGIPYILARSWEDVQTALKLA